MLEFFKRLDNFMVYSGLNDNRITVECGISNGLIGKARLRGSLSQDNISKILKKYPNLDANWLMTGRGGMIIQDIDIDKKSIQIITPENVINFKSKNIGNNPNPNRFVQSNFGSADFLIEIQKSTNSQKFSIGDFLACKKIQLKDVLLQWNNVYILDTVFGIWIKKIMKGKDDEHFLILSENPSHDPFEIRISEIKAIALVIGVIKLE
jgi:hypothetical protein